MSAWYTKANEIFLAALEIAPDQQAAYLQEACGGQTDLLAQVGALLTASERAGDFLESPPSAILAVVGQATLPVPSAGHPPEPPGTRIGPYKLLQQIGEGGFGVVYMAEQQTPVRRKVALKIIKPGMDTKEVIARFESERQALALMDHPNIAKVLDAGTTEEGVSGQESGVRSGNANSALTPDPRFLTPGLGRPYFVMELVKGVPITDYCDSNHLPPAERLELFIQVCNALQHAHQKGIIHRDLKPSNVMVTMHDGRPVPKVIDFGVAKATSQTLTERTLFTAYGQMIGTPAYMSPEQAEMSCLDIDTRSDIYSLGVLLYELLTGTTPFEAKRLREAGFAEMARIIKEEEPESVSTRIAKIRRVGASPAQSSRHTPGAVATNQERSRPPNPKSKIPNLKSFAELDWIVAHSLEKDRERRYESASSFAHDIRRFLSDEPVQACPPSNFYRFRKFVRRHKSRVATAGILSAVVATAAVVAIVSYNRHVRSEHELVESVAQSLSASRAAIDAGDLTLAQERVAQAQGRLAQKRSKRIQLISTVEGLAKEVNDRQLGHQAFERFMKLSRDAQNSMGMSDGVGGETEAQEAIELFRVGSDVHWIESLNQCYLSADQKSQVRETAYQLLVCLADSKTRWNHRRGGDAGSFRRSLELLDQARSFHEPTRAFWFVRWQALAQLKEYQAAKDAEERFRTVPSITAWDYYLPGHSAGWGGDLEEAIRSYHAALRIKPDHYNSLFFLAKLLALEKINRVPEAIAYYCACAALKPHHQNVYWDRAKCLEKLGNLDAAEADLTSAIAAAENDIARHNAFVYRRLFHKRMGRDPLAQRDLEEAIATLQQSLKKASQPATVQATARNNLAWALVITPDCSVEDAARAVELAKQAIELAPTIAEYWNTLGVAEYRCHHWQSAVSTLEKSIAVRHGGDGYDWYFLALAHLRLGNNEEAHKWYSKAAVWRDVMSEDSEEIRAIHAEASGIPQDVITAERKSVTANPMNPGVADQFVRILHERASCLKEQIIAQVRRGDLSLPASETKEASILLEEAIELCGQLILKFPDNAGYKYRLDDLLKLQALHFGPKQNASTTVLSPNP